MKAGAQSAQILLDFLSASAGGGSSVPKPIHVGIPTYKHVPPYMYCT